VTRKLITIVGCGPGARECVTLEAFDAVLDAEVLIGAPRLLRLFEEATAERIPTRGNISEVSAAILANRRRRIAILVTGDPGIASLAHPILERFGLMACHVIPGVSSVQVAFARLGMDWIGARILSAHGDLPRTDFATLDGESKIAILTGSAGAAQWVADLAEHLGQDWKLFLAENLTLPGEAVRAISPAELRQIPCATLSILILLRSA
jgi:precorrin-6y C5,15-methyltransferase (decarboxylating) CbiE subunit